MADCVEEKGVVFFLKRCNNHLRHMKYVVVELRNAITRNYFGVSQNDQPNKHKNRGWNVVGGKAVRKLIYVKGCVFTQGEATIYDETNDAIGSVHRDAEGSVQVHNLSGRQIAHGKYIPNCQKWVVMNHDGQAIGQLKDKFSLFGKKCEYNVYERGLYTIQYDVERYKFSVRDKAGKLVAELRKQDDDSFCLTKEADQLSMFELLSVLKTLTVKSRMPVAMSV